MSETMGHIGHSPDFKAEKKKLDGLHGMPELRLTGDFLKKAEAEIARLEAGSADAQARIEQLEGEAREANGEIGVLVKVDREIRNERDKAQAALTQERERREKAEAERDVRHGELVSVALALGLTETDLVDLAPAIIELKERADAK